MDPHRAGHEVSYYPGETNVRLADVVVINKVDTAPPEAVTKVRENVRALNPRARIVDAACPVKAADPSVLKGKKVLAIDDGPTLTHGGMAFGAAVLAAWDAGARELVDPRPFAVGEIAATLARYPHVKRALPALGYGDAQIRDLETTIARAAEHGVEAVAIGTPIDLARLIRIPDSLDPRELRDRAQGRHARGAARPGPEDGDRPLIADETTPDCRSSTDRRAGIPRAAVVFRARRTFPIGTARACPLCEPASQRGPPGVSACAHPHFAPLRARNVRQCCLQLGTAHAGRAEEGAWSVQLR